MDTLPRTTFYELQANNRRNSILLVLLFMALVGALGTNAYRSRTRTAEDIEFLVGDEAFETHAGGYVTMRVPVIEFEGVALDQVPLTPTLRVIEEDLNRPP